MTLLRRRATLLVAVLLAWLLVPARALAATPQQEPDSNALVDWMAAQVNDLMIEGMKAAATLFWFIEKAGAGFTRFLTNEDLWTTVLQAALGSLTEIMPGVLTSLIFADNGGAGGILYLALMLAGILLIVPNFGTARLVDASRVILWALIVATLFISATAGYDLIGYIEQMRNSATQIVVQAASEEDNLDALVAAPMMATTPAENPDTNDMEDYSFVLPAAFEAEYFPEPNPDTDFEDRGVFDFGGLISWTFTIRVETEASQQERREKAQTGLAIAGLTLVPGWVLVLFGVVFATLTAAALVLIVFFIVAIPLGFFEFGAAILSGLVKQYAYLFAVTLLAVTLAGILARAGLTTFETPAPDPGEIMDFIPILLIVAIAMSYVAKMATGAMTATFGIVSTSIQQSMSPLVYAGSLPAAGGIPGADLAGVVGAGAAALATGGMSAALLAAGGTALANTHAGAGRAAAQVAVAGGGGDRSHVFAAAARGQGTTGVLAQTLRHERRDRDAAHTAFGAVHTRESKRPAAEWGAVDAGAFHTTDTGHLDAAEAAYDAGKTVEARQHLERAFGNRAVAEQALGLYQREGRAGQQRVRGIVDATQTVAGGMARQGQGVFDATGSATPAFRQNLEAELAQRALFNPRSATDAALVAHIAGATVRQPVGIWAAPDATRRLARETLHPLTTSEAIPGDVSAQFQLHALATQHGWNEAQVETLFEATRLGQGAAAASGQPPATEAVRLLRQQGEWDQTPAPLLGEASRLALAVAENAQAQRGVTLELPVEAPVAPAATPSALTRTPPPSAAPTPAAPPAAATPERTT